MNGLCRDYCEELRDFMDLAPAYSRSGLGTGLKPIAMCRDYCEGLRDSLDLVPIGAWHGNGRKVGWLSPFLLAAWDPEAEEFQSVCRCMSGFTDAFYTEVESMPCMTCRGL